MIAGLDPSALAELALMLVAVGALAGFLAGVFGIGGGAVLVPVFYECFRLAGVPLEVRMPLCVGTSLAVIIPTSISSFRAHYLRGAVDMNILKIWWLPIVIGVVAGSITARFAPERLFKYVFVMVAWSAATRLLLARENWKFGDEMPKGPVIAKVARNFKPPAGDCYVRVESARGDMGWYVVSDGTAFPHRCKIRTGSFAAMSIIQKVSRNLMIADLIAVIASFDLVAPEIDR